MDEATRIDRLEMRLTEQDATIEDLNRTVTEQWRVIDRLVRQLDLLREQVQEHILDQLQTLLDRRLIKGIYENGTEYTAIATALNMKKELVRLIQKFDFTRQNPKAVYINAGEKVISLEDSILMALLHLMGFDVVFFVPTGYRSVEGHFQGGLLEEHQLGEYMYDLRVPDFAAAGSGAGKRGWMERIFRKA